MKTDQINIRTIAQTRCLVCGSAGTSLYVNLTDRLYSTPGKWNLSKCANSDCGLLWLDPMPLEEDIGRAYESYYTHARRSVPFFEWLLTLLLYGSLGLLYERQCSDVMYLNGIRPGRLLEIGFGDASRLERLKALGWQVEGLEVDPIAVKNARERGLSVHEGSLETCQLEADCFDAIIGSHVIEHVHDPQGMTRECYRLLKSGGTMVLCTPNSESYGHRVFAENCIHLDPPRHIQIFAASNMRRLILNAGFKEVRVWTSMAKSGSAFRGSIDIRQRGQHKVGEFPRLRIAVEELYHMFRARFLQLTGSANGEELIVTAAK